MERLKLHKSYSKSPADSARSSPKKNFNNSNSRICNTCRNSIRPISSHSISEIKRKSHDSPTKIFITSERMSPEPKMLSKQYSAKIIRPFTKMASMTFSNKIQQMTKIIEKRTFCENKIKQKLNRAKSAMHISPHRKPITLKTKLKHGKCGSTLPECEYRALFQARCKVFFDYKY